MIERQNFLPVNWVDGMKINKNHFIATQDYVSDSLRDVRGGFLTAINYGLLPMQGTGQSVKINMSIDNHNLLRVHVDECFAVTPNGCRIEISSVNTREEQLSSEFVEASFALEDHDNRALLINITASALNKVPFGAVDPQEQPPRPPYLLPEYQLSLVPIRQNQNYVNTGFEMTLGLIEFENGEPRLQQNYIPPCTVTNAHQFLKQSFFEIDSFFGQMELLCVQISKKINAKTQTNNLSEMLLVMCDQMSQFLATVINQYRWTGLSQPPVYVFEKPVALARVMKNYVDSKSGSGKEELLNYFAEWCGLSQADFELLFTDTVNTEYQHTQISLISEQVKYFVKNILELFEALNKLDYIGRRKDTGIFVKERVVEQDINKGRRSRSFLDE